MKIDFYFDWYPGMELKYATAFAQANGAKPSGGKRYKFTVDIDDPNCPEVVQEVKAEW